MEERSLYALREWKCLGCWRLRASGGGVYPLLPAIHHYELDKDADPRLRCFLSFYIADADRALFSPPW